jgi:hypothetical protein
MITQTMIQQSFWIEVGIHDMVLELAVKAGCESIITYNTRDFAGVDQFGLKLLEPSEFLRSIGKLP